jgi:hypothetical protein
MKTQEVIDILQKLVDEHGDLPFHIYKSFQKQTVGVRDNDIAFDEKEKDIYLAIY